MKVEYSTKIIRCFKFVRNRLQPQLSPVGKESNTIYDELHKKAIIQNKMSQKKPIHCTDFSIK